MPHLNKGYNPLLKSFPDSEKINAVSLGAETLYLRLIAQSDDNGNYWGDPPLVLGKLYTLRMDAKQVGVDDVARWLDELRAVGLVKSYRVKGRTYINLINCYKV